MPDNRALFLIVGKPWTLAVVSMVLGLALLVIGGGLLAVLLFRHGETRRLEAFAVGCFMPWAVINTQLE